MNKPTPRGPVSATLLEALSGPVRPLTELEPPAGDVGAPPALLEDDDFQLALFCLYELHYAGMDGVDDRWEWHPELLAFRSTLERDFERELRELAPVPDLPPATAEAVAAALFEMAGADDGGPSVSRYIARKARPEHLREYLVHRSLYQLREADPHSFVLPRLSGRSKAALVEIQTDEYGGGRLERMHSAMFARTMRDVGLDDRYGAYVDLVPAVSLASLNMMSMFALHRRLRGAIVGQLVAYEATSSAPNKLLTRGFRRHGYGEDVTAYFEEHVEADAVHEQIAARDLAGGLAEADPSLVPDILFGAAAELAVGALVGAHQVSAWQGGRSALRSPLAMAA